MSNVEQPELGDYSREKYISPEISPELEPVFDLANSLERNAKSDPIDALKTYLEAAKRLVAKLL